MADKLTIDIWVCRRQQLGQTKQSIPTGSICDAETRRDRWCCRLPDEEPVASRLVNLDASIGASQAELLTSTPTFLLKALGML